MKRFTTIQFFIYLANGLFTPAWYVLLYQRGGDISQFGALVGVLAFGSAFAALFSGYLSHTNPYKMLAISVAIQGLVMLLYIPSSPLWVLYVLQLAYGVISTALITTEQICISRLSGGDGKRIGKYAFLIHGSIAVGMIASGFIAAVIGGPLVITISATILLILSVLI